MDSRFTKVNAFQSSNQNSTSESQPNFSFEIYATLLLSTIVLIGMKYEL